MSFGLNQYLALGTAAITSKQKISFSPGGRIIHICSRLRNPESPLRATYSLQAHMQSKRLKYHGAHFPNEKNEVKGLDKGHTEKYVKCQNTPRASSVQSLSHVWLFTTPWIKACQASLSVTNSWSSLRLTSIKSVMPSSHLILCRPLLLLPPFPPSIRVFPNESTLCMRWPKYWSFSFSISPSNEHPGLISFRTGWISLQYKGLSRVFSNMQIKTTVTYHITLVRMAIIKMSTNNKCWRKYRENGTLLHCWYKYKLVQLLWRTVWRLLKKLKIELPYDLAIWFLVRHISGENHNLKRYMYLNVHCSTIYRASPIAQLVKNRLQSATQETLVQFLGWEDPLEKG